MMNGRNGAEAHSEQCASEHAPKYDQSGQSRIHVVFPPLRGSPGASDPFIKFAKKVRSEERKDRIQNILDWLPLHVKNFGNARNWRSSQPVGIGKGFGPDRFQQR